MIVPRYWAEARVQRRDGRRSVTVRRFGWSDVSVEAAQKHADSRVEEALEAILAGQPLHRRELKAHYNGSVGVPIREEIVASYDDIRITRNSYGALCLNTPDVLFVDIDFAEGPPGILVALSALAVFSVFASIMKTLSPAARIFGSLLAAAVFAGQLAAVRWRINHWLHGTEEEQAIKRIQAFVDARPDWLLRVYRTPGGMRAVAMHRPFDPHEDEVADCFRELEADEVYVQMCVRQNCFRARVSPKPWRIGLGRHIKPRTAAWPVSKESMPAREAWIREYERLSADYASCRWMGDYGTGTAHPKAKVVQELHDQLSQANSDLPLG